MINTVTLSGKVIDSMEYFTKNGHKYYNMTLQNKRKSGKCDYIRVVFYDGIELEDKPYARVCGQLKTYTEGNETELSVHAYTVNWLDEEDNTNMVSLEGEIEYKTRMRWIGNTQLLPFGVKTDYCTVPCAIWGMDAGEVWDAEKGTMLMIRGRLQNKKHGTQLSGKEIEWISRG